MTVEGSNLIQGCPSCRGRTHPARSCFPHRQTALNVVDWHRIFEWEWVDRTMWHRMVPGSSETSARRWEHVKRTLRDRGYGPLLMEDWEAEANGQVRARRRLRLTAPALARALRILDRVRPLPDPTVMMTDLELGVRINRYREAASGNLHWGNMTQQQRFDAAMI